MIKQLTPKELKAGMIALEPIVTPLGQPIAPAGAELTRQIINKMKLYNCEYAVVDIEDESAPEEFAPDPLALVLAAEEPLRVEAPVVKEQKTRAEESKTHSQKIVESDAFHTGEMVGERFLNRWAASEGDIPNGRSALYRLLS